MIEFLYTANPLAAKPARENDRQIAPVMLYGFQPFDPIAMAIDADDRNATERRAAVMAHYFAPAEAFAQYLAPLLFVDPATLSTDTLATAREFDARTLTLLEAGRAYLRAINPGKSDAELFGSTPLSLYGLAWQRWSSAGHGGAEEYTMSRATLTTRIGACVTEYAKRVPSAPTATTTTTTPTTTSTSPTPVVSNTNAATLARWRAVLSDARRLETDAINIGLALAGVLTAWREAGDYPDQVRTLTGLLQDASANADYARQLAAALTTVIQVGETVVATGVGTMPPDPVVPPPPALPTVMPSRPDGSVPEVEATSVPTDPAALENSTAPVVKPGISKGTMVAILLALLSILT